MEKTKSMITGIEYNINVSQVGAVEAGLKGKVDLIDLSIYDTMLKYSIWKGCQWVSDESGQWFWFSWTVVRDRLPMSGLKSRTPIRRRIKKLIDCQLLEQKPSKPGDQKSYYRVGRLHEIYQGYKKAADLKRPSPEKDTTPSQPSTRPRLNGDHNDSTNDITDIDVSLKEVFSLKIQTELTPLESAWADWIEYKKEQHKFSYKSEKFELQAKKNLWTLAGGNENLAIQIINYTIGQGWKGLRKPPKDQIPQQNSFDKAKTAIINIQNGENDERFNTKF